MEPHTQPQTVEGYESFFGFSRPPFDLAPDTRFLYPSASHREAFAQVTYALERRERILVVTGDIGTGKTLLCRTVLERLDRKTFVSIVNDPLLERDELLTQMLLDFGIVSTDRATWTPASRHDLMHALHDFLVSLPPLHAHAVVVIDEAQHLRPDVLEDIRLLSNVDDEHGTMLQIVLLGQDDLHALLARHELRQLQQRVSRFIRLEPLSPVEVAAYINYRLAVARDAGASSTFPGATELQQELARWQSPDVGVTFTPAALEAVARWSRGTPRIVNLLCDRALESAFAAQARTVDEPLVTAAAWALRLADPAPEQPLADAAADQSRMNPQMFDEPAAVPAVAPNRAPKFRVRPYAVATIVVLGAALWLAWRTIPDLQRSPAPQAGPEAPAAATSPAPAAQSPIEEPRTETQPGAAATPPPTPAAPVPTPPAPVPAPTPEARTLPAGAVDLVVASFRTAARANEVAAVVAAAGEPVRLRTTAGWQQVIAGPYGTRADGERAQQRLARSGLSGTQLVLADR